MNFALSTRKIFARAATCVLALACCSIGALAQAPKAKTGKRGDQAPAARPPDASRIKVPAGVKFLADIVYREGNKMWKLDLAVPEAKSAAPRPGIVFIHGGGWRSGDKRLGYFLPGAFDYAAKGYVCATINYRLTDEAPFPACVEDVRCAVRWLRAHAADYGLDPHRIGGYGNSAGAHLVCLLALAGPEPTLDGDAPDREQSSLLQAVCASATPTDFTAKLDANRSRYLQAGGFLAGPADTLLERAKKASPTSYVRADAPPILLIHGDADGLVDPEQPRLLHDALKQAGAADVALITVHGASHNVFAQHANLTHPIMEAFFARTLKP